MRTTPILAVALTLTVALKPTAAAAGEWSFTVGGGGAVAPDYVGSDDYDVSPFPNVNLSWQADKASSSSKDHGIFLGVHDVSLGLGGLDVGLVRLATPAGNYVLRLGLGYEGGREDDDNDALRGLGDIDNHLQGRIAVEGQWHDGGPFYGITFETDLSDETDGSTVTASFGQSVPFGEKLSLTGAVDVTWADGDYMQSYFGITTRQAMTSRYARFDAEAGLARVGVNLVVDYKLTKGWGLFGTASYARLTGDAVDSPLVKDEGSANQFISAFGIKYTF